MKADANPSRIEPILVPRIWGRRRSHPLLDAGNLPTQPIGEVWLSGEECRFADGPFAGKSLGHAWREMPQEWQGERSVRERGFPLLAKFLFPEATLSIQVHPSDAYAAQHETAAGGRGKTEMWHAVEAESGAEALVGLEPGMSRESVRCAIADGSIDTRLRQTAISAGDTIYVPAGTAHTIRPGVVLCEVQEYSDLTYRLFDYNRVDASGKPRELHVEKALDVIDFASPAAGKTKPITRRRGPIEVTHLAACRHFAAERWRFDEPADFTGSADHFDLLIFFAGDGSLVGSGGHREYHRGQAWFVPAESGEFRFEPATQTTVLRAYVPDLEALKQQLSREGVTREEMNGFLFE